MKQRTKVILGTAMMVVAMLAVPFMATRASSDKDFELVAETSGGYLEAGDTVTVKLNLNSFETNYTFYTLGVQYDADKFTYTGKVAGLAQYIEENTLTDDMIDVTPTLNPDAAPALQTGLLATLNFEVKSGVSGGTADFSIHNPEFWDADGNSYVATGSGASVNIAQPITAISITNTETAVGLGEDLTLITSVTPSDATDATTVTWSSSDTNIATVSSDGMLHGVATGNVTITATSTARPSVTTTKTFEVTSALTGIKLDKTSLDITKGNDETLIASPIPATTTDDATVSWSSSDDTIATVDNNGKVTAVGYGTATITATSNYNNNFKATASVEVTNHLNSISIDASNLTALSEGGYQILSGDANAKTLMVNYNSAVTADDTTDTGTLAWTAEDDSILEIDNSGKVTGKKSGTTTITASFAGKTDTIAVKVHVPVDSVSLPDDFALDPGQEKDVTLTINPSDADHGDVSWISSDTEEKYIELVGDGKNGTIKVRAKSDYTLTPVTLTATLDGKSDTINVSVNEIAIESVSIDKTNVTLKIENGVADEAVLTASILPTTANTDKTIAWSSSDDTVATVDSNGKVTAVAAGTATITATSANGKTATSTVKVIIPLESVSPDENEITIHKGETANLSYTLTPSNTTETTPVAYASRNETVATVSNSGVISGVAVGDAIVTVTVAGKTADVTVHVDSPLTSISFSDASVNMYKNSQKTFAVIFDPFDATDGRDITWTSSDETIATVDANGKVTAKESGMATITATSDKTSVAPASFTVNVKENHLTGISIADTTATLLKGKTYALGVTLTKEDENADTTDEVNLEWESSDATIATVDGDGKVTGKKAGKVNITVKNGTLTAETEITVEEISLTGVTLVAEKSELTVGETISILATLVPLNATDEVNFTWLSSNEDIVTVDANGNVTAVAPGTVIITLIANDGIKSQVELTVVAAAPDTGRMTGIAAGAASTITVATLVAVAMIMVKFAKEARK